VANVGDFAKSLAADTLGTDDKTQDRCRVPLPFEAYYNKRPQSLLKATPH